MSILLFSQVLIKENSFELYVFGFSFVFSTSFEPILTDKIQFSLSKLNIFSVKICISSKIIFRYYLYIRKSSLFVMSLKYSTICSRS